MDLGHDDQRYGEVIHLSQLAIEICGSLRRLQSFGLAPVGQRAICRRQIGVDVRLQRRGADLRRELQSGQRHIDCPFRFNRAVNDAEIRIAAARDVEQPQLARRRDAALDALAGRVELAGARERDADRVRRVRDRGRYRLARLRSGGGGIGKRELRRLERPFGPLDRLLILAGPERRHTELLVEVRHLEVCGRSLERVERTAVG